MSDLKSRLVEEGVFSSLKRAEEGLKAIFSAVGDELAAGHDVKLGGVGKLKVVKTKARVGRNPSTGAEIQIPAGRKVSLSVSASMKEQLKG